MPPPVIQAVSAAAPIMSTSGTTTSTITNSTASTGPSDCAPRICARPCSMARAGAVIPRALTKPPKTKTTASAATSRRRDSHPMPDLRRGSTSSSPGTRVAIAMLSCGHACTQSRQKVQSRFPALAGRKSDNSHPRRSTRDGTVSIAPSLDAVDGPTRPARVGLPHLHFERRHRRCDEAELTDRAEVLTEGRSGEQKIDRERNGEITQHEPGCRARQRPQIVELVYEKHRDEQRDADPFDAKPARPSSRGRPQTPPGVAHEHEWAAGAEEVSGRQQREDQPSTVVHP